MKTIKADFNGNAVTVMSGMTILEAARENGIEIPTLCYLKDFSPIGACRLCVVEVEGSRTLVGSCHTPIAEGMVIRTHSPKVLEVRRTLIELMLASHPDSCLVCDKANLCGLRNIAADFNIGLPRFRVKKHYFPVEDQNPGMLRDMSKCVLCRRCVLACQNLNGDKLFSLAYRGFESKVIYGLDEPLAPSETCENCEACVALCPTGALRQPVRVGKEKKGQVLFLKG
jgi:NADH dehydrogenase/NADH:ubiquinone oxidoreductase subunit G